MISWVIRNSNEIAKMFVVIMMVVVLLSQSTVSAQSAAMANKSTEAEVKALVAKMKTEVERRITENTEAIAALESSNTITGTVKTATAKALAETKAALQQLKKKIDEAKDLKSAKELAVTVDSQYDQYANSNASAQTLKDGDAQQQSFTQLQTTTVDARAMIDSAESSGKDVTSLKEHVGNLDKLVQSIGAIIASVIALITSLAGGNFTAAAPIFQAIIGQLSQNLVSISTAQTELGGIVESLNSFQALTAGAVTE